MPQSMQEDAGGIRDRELIAPMSSAARQVLVLFDLDHTLIPCDSNSQWLAFLSERGLVDAGETVRRNGEFFRSYMDGSLNIHEYTRFQLRPLAGRSVGQMQGLRREFAAQRLEPQITHKARSLVSEHREHGHLLALITATHGFLAAAAAEIFGIEHVIATTPRIEQGVFTGDVDGMPCFRESKLECLAFWLSSQGLSMSDFRETWFYSDSANDLHLMREVTRPVAVDPDDQLRAHARQCGWPVISLR